MIRIVIIDDEAHGIKTLELLLQKASYPTIILATFQDTEEALIELRKIEFDILFLDIHMPKVNGFSFLTQLQSINFSIVFTTAYGEYAIQAFKFAAFDYILKPIGIRDIEDCLTRWQQQQRQRHQLEQLNFLQSLLKEKKISDKINISTKDGYIIITIEDIIYCKSYGNYTLFILEEGKNITTTKQLKDIEELLTPLGFERIHKSYLINSSKIVNIATGKDYYIIMNNQDKIPVSRGLHDYINNNLLKHFTN